MPELPEVETIVRRLRLSLINQKILKVRVFTPKILRQPPALFAQRLRGAIIRDIRRKGKFILIGLEPKGMLIIHLKMTGQILLESKSKPYDQHTHVLFSFVSSPVQMRYRDIRKFGFMDLSSSGAEEDLPYIRKVGPDPFEVSPKIFFHLIHNKNKSIKSLLLDQSVISGLGNIYVDESLFQAGLHPQTKAMALSPDQSQKLYRIIKNTLSQAIRFQGSTLRNFKKPDGKSGGFQKFHQVYRRKDLPCPVCRSPIQKMIVGGRGTHYCAHCQKMSYPNTNR
jgi:formamidopyrimidine-DNA glycosylase